MAIYRIPERSLLRPGRRLGIVRRKRVALTPRVRSRDLSSYTDPLAAKALKSLGRR